MSSSQAKAPVPTAGRAQGGGSAHWVPGAHEVAVAVTVAAAFCLAYRSSFHYLLYHWNRDPNYNYGYFVVPIALAIFWSRRGMLDPARVNPRWWGFLPLLAVVSVRYPLYEWNEQFVETATVPLVAACLVYALGGWHMLRVAYPSLIFLFFMIPLPQSINQWLAQPLQRVATIGTVAVLESLGLPVMSEGNVIIIGATPLEVARACNGLSMLLSFVTLIAATVLLIDRPAWERVVLLLSAVPIALVSNVLRITATALCYHRLGQEAGDKIAHDMAGLMMMPLALALVWAELKVMSLLFVEVEDIDTRAAIQRLRGGNRPSVR